MSTEYVTDYAAKQVPREAYIDFINRVCAKYDERDCPAPAFPPPQRPARAIVEHQP